MFSLVVPKVFVQCVNVEKSRRDSKSLSVAVG